MFNSIDPRCLYRHIYDRRPLSHSTLPCKLICNAAASVNNDVPFRKHFAKPGRSGSWQSALAFRDERSIPLLVQEAGMLLPNCTLKNLNRKSGHVLTVCAEVQEGMPEAHRGKTDGKEHKLGDVAP